MCKVLIIRKRGFFFFWALLFGYFSATAQDIHNSQYWLYPVGLNPAAAGFFDGTLRLGGYNRTQWRSITKAFQTVGISADMPLAKRPWKRDLFGFGIMMNYDQTGDSRYTTADANLSFSYAHAVNRRNNSFLMGGVSLGCVQRSWDYTQLSFDEQYVGGFYDPKSPISETFMGSNIWFFDCGLGLQWFYQPDYNEYYQAGFSIYHLNRPEITMLADKEVRLHIRYAFHAVSSIRFNDKQAIIPSVYLSFQHQYREIMFGTQYSHQLPLDAKGYLNKMKIGLYYRWEDAVFLSVGMDYRRCMFGISYDFNVSGLFPASHVRGGVELCASYILKKQKYRKIAPIPCTVFDK
ncbi:MAG: PorP/SprF family type IX secretion system membrane protein [Lentimicrobiaceae bacterium]|nr:PorP/SprF family type IX secretion system membrane protein [Lentimicrobiaceae bacterium]